MYLCGDRRSSDLWQDASGAGSALCHVCGMGAVFGHNNPFYMKFKGGKGIAATAGLLASTLPLP